MTQYSTIIGCSNLLASGLKQFKSPNVSSVYFGEGHWWRRIVSPLKEWDADTSSDNNSLKSTTELKFHFPIQNSVPKLKTELNTQFPFPKRNGPALYNNIKIVSSSSFPRPVTCWSNINPQAGWAYIYTVPSPSTPEWDWGGWCPSGVGRDWTARSTFAGWINHLGLGRG